MESHDQCGFLLGAKSEASNEYNPQESRGQFGIWSTKIQKVTKICSKWNWLLAFWRFTCISMVHFGIIQSGCKTLITSYLDPMKIFQVNKAYMQIQSAFQLSKLVPRKNLILSAGKPYCNMNFSDLQVQEKNMKEELLLSKNDLVYA